MSTAASMRVKPASQIAVRSGTRVPAPATRLDPAAIQQQTDRILNSSPFQRSERMGRFLSYIVSKALADQAGAIKEYNLGVDVFDRGRDFDPRVDSVVRVEARRLRAMLLEYYRVQGAQDRVRIVVPVGAYVPEISLNGAAEGSRTVARGHAAAPVASVAVLPFSDLSAEGNQGHFCDGIVDQLIDALVSTGELRVLSRTSTVRLRGKQEDLGAISSELGVDWVVEGSVRTWGNAFRIDARLVNAEDGYLVWSRVYQREAAGIFHIQDEICDAIARSLHVHLAGRAPKGRTTAEWNHFEAYSEFLRGRREWARQTPQSLRRALHHYEHAAAIDPKYVAAHLGMAHCYRHLGFWGGMPPKVALDKSVASALEALTADPACGEAHAALGAAMSIGDGKWESAEIEFRRATALAPDSPAVWQMYALLHLVPQRRFDEALDCISRMDDFDCAAPYHFFAPAWTMLVAGDIDRCVETCTRNLSWDRQHVPATLALSCAYQELGRIDDAIDTLQTADAAAAGHPDVKASLGHCYGLAGQPERAQEVLKDLAASESGTSCHTALIHAGLGDREAVYDQLSAAVKEGSPGMIWAHVDPRFKTYRSEPVFARMFRKLGLSAFVNLIWPFMMVLDSPLMDVLP